MFQSSLLQLKCWREWEQEEKMEITFQNHSYILNSMIFNNSMILRHVSILINITVI